MTSDISQSEGATQYGDAIKGERGKPQTMTEWGDRQRNKTVADAVVSVVDHQTGGPQPDQIAASRVVMHLSSNGNEDAQEVREALDEAVADGRLERDEDHVWVPA